MCGNKYNFERFKHLDNGDDKFITTFESSCPGCQNEICEAISVKQQHEEYNVSLVIGNTLHFKMKVIDKNGSKVAV